MVTPRLDLVGFTVSDMGRALRFYAALGVPVDLEAAGEPHVEAVLDGGLRLAWDTEDVVRSFHPDWTPPAGGQRVGAAFLCGSPAEVDELYEQAIAAGGSADTDPWDAAWGQRYAIVADPDGTLIDLFAPLA